MISLETKRLSLRMAEATDAAAIAAYFKRNETHLAPTSPLLPAGVQSPAYWEERIAKSLEEFRAGSSLRLFLFPKVETRVIGVVSYTQMFRAAFQACYLGYNIDQASEGKGLMFEALVRANAYVFQELNFHRIMANHLPENTRSAKILEKLGFTREGLAKDYLRINGKWRDHVLNSLCNPDWQEK